MKRCNEMTHEELVALTDDQVRRLIEIEIAFAAIKPVEVPVEPTLESAGITAGVIGYKIGELIFLNEEDAQTVAALPGMKEKYAYDISYKHHWLEPAGDKVEKTAYYRQEDVLRIGGALKENEKRSSVYRKNKQDFDKFLRETTEISSNIWQAVREAQDALNKIEAGKRAYQKYLSLADGDHQIAAKFFRDAFKDEEGLVKTILDSEYVEIVQCVENKNNQQKGNEDGKN